MTVVLDRATFRRLVWLHLVFGTASIAAVAPTYLVDRWRDFGVAFDVLVAERFGVNDTPDTVVIVLGVIGLAGIIWMLASIVGLLRFRRWGRTGSVGSVLLMFALYPFMLGFRPFFLSPLEYGLAFIDSALFGAIVLLAFAKDHGAVWFARPIAD